MASFWAGLRFRRDARHEDARRIWESGPGALLTTNLMLGETWTFLRRKAGPLAFDGDFAAVGFVEVRPDRRGIGGRRFVVPGRERCADDGLCVIVSA